MTPEEAALRRIWTRSIAIGTASAAVAFFVGWRAGVSLTIAAAVVIFSLLVFEKLTARLVPQQEKVSLRTLLPLLLVTLASLVLLGVVLLRWRGFEPIAGAVGLSTVALAIIPEAWVRNP